MIVPSRPVPSHFPEQARVPSRDAPASGGYGGNCTLPTPHANQAEPTGAGSARTRTASPCAPGIAPPAVVRASLAGLRLASTANRREHWGARRKREAPQLRALWEALRALPVPAAPWLVTITRVGPRRLDDDNATSAAKHLRDAIARWLGVDDGDESRVRFVVTQARGPYRVDVEIRHAGEVLP